MQEQPLSNPESASPPSGPAIRKETVRIKIPSSVPVLPSTPIASSQIEASPPQTRTIAPRPGSAAAPTSQTVPRQASAAPTSYAPPRQASAAPTSQATPRQVASPPKSAPNHAPQNSRSNLPSQGGQRAPVGPPRPSPRPEDYPNAQAAPPKKSKKKLILAILFIVVAAEVAGVILFRQYREKQASIPKPNLEVLLPPLQVPGGAPEIDHVKILAEKLSQDAAKAAIKAKKDKHSEPKENEEPSNSTNEDSDKSKNSDIRDGKKQPKIYSPNANKAIAALKNGSTALMEGVLKDIVISDSQNSIYFIFSKPYIDSQVRGAILRKLEDGKLLELSDFESYIGKKITLDGKVVYKKHMEGHFIQISGIEDLTVSQ